MYFEYLFWCIQFILLEHHGKQYTKMLETRFSIDSAVRFKGADLSSHTSSS